MEDFPRISMDFDGFPRLSAGFKGLLDGLTRRVVRRAEVLERPALYVVSTPIGNLGDITLRALQVLKEADAIYAEDTRATGLLLRRLDIKLRGRPLLQCHGFNEDVVGVKMIGMYVSGIIPCMYISANGFTLYLRTAAMCRDKLSHKYAHG